MAYTSYRGASFDVFNELDIEYFKKNPRFSTSKKSTVAPKEAPEESLKKSLEAVKGLLKKSIETVLASYSSETILKDEIRLDELRVKSELKLSEKQWELLLKALNDKKDEQVMD